MFAEGVQHAPRPLARLALFVPVCTASQLYRPDLMGFSDREMGLAPYQRPGAVAPTRSLSPADVIGDASVFSIIKMFASREAGTR